ncbi:phosphoribosyltransferase [Gemmatimonas sp.]
MSVPTYAEALEVVKRDARGLVSPSREDACPLCAGICGPGFQQCSGCHLLMKNGAKRELLRRVLPVTTALDPGPWYTTMATYKTAQPERVYYLAAALAAAVLHFGEALAKALGGAPDVVCITPSSSGRTLEEQRLLDVVKTAHDVLPPCEPLLTHVDGMPKPNNTVRPEVYTGDARQIEGRRVLLIDDTWVSGASVTSAAMRLEQLGAQAVAMVVLARRIERNRAGYFESGADFVKSIDATHWTPDGVRWPRRAIL